jgi:hypothetical protein
MIIEIDSDLVLSIGRKLGQFGDRLSWKEACARLKEGEKLVVVSSYALFPWYGFLIEDEESYYAVATTPRCEGIYAAGPELLAHQRPFVPYDGP